MFTAEHLRPPGAQGWPGPCCCRARVMALESVTSSGRQPSWSRSPGSAPACSSSSTMSRNSQVAAGGAKGRVSAGMLARGGGCSWRQQTPAQQLARHSRARQGSEHNVSLQEKGQSESNAKPRVPRGCKQQPEPAVQSEVLGAEVCAGHHLGHRASLEQLG